MKTLLILSGIIMTLLLSGCMREEDSSKKIEHTKSDQPIYQFYTDDSNKYDSGGNMANQASFSESDIQLITSKLDTNNEIKINTGSLKIDNYSISYISSTDHINDKFLIETNGTQKYIELPYNELNKKVLQDSGYDDLQEFNTFITFSPNDAYIEFSVWVGGHGSSTHYVMEKNTGKIVFTVDSIRATSWSPDKKYFIYASQFSGISIVRVGEFSQSINIGGDLSFPKVSLDDSYIYSIGCKGMDCDPKMLKIYSIDSGTEIFSKVLDK